MAKRLTIHPPYLVNRAPARDNLAEFRKVFDGALSELHRWLRYARDANDDVQNTLDGLTGDGPESAPTVAEMHAKIMIRVSLDF